MEWFSIIIICLIIWLIIRHIQKSNHRYIDCRGYIRDGYDKLIHRKIAYKYLYNVYEFPLRFRDYVIHHKDRNKKNNHPNNLQILTQEEHNKIHGYI